jgi:ketosteroid isomerase-like protein
MRSPGRSLCGSGDRCRTENGRSEGETAFRGFALRDTEPAMSQENAEIVREMVEAFNRDDFDGVMAAFHEDCEVHEPPEMPDRPALGFRGHAGIREWMEKLRGIAGVHFEPRGFITSGDVIVSEWASRGRGEASGVPIEWTTFAVLRMREGKIARADGFLSRDEALEAAGLRD